MQPMRRDTFMSDLVQKLSLRRLIEPQKAQTAKRRKSDNLLPFKRTCLTSSPVDMTGQQGKPTKGQAASLLMDNFREGHRLTSQHTGGELKKLCTSNSIARKKQRGAPPCIPDRNGGEGQCMKAHMYGEMMQPKPESPRHMDWSNSLAVHKAQQIPFCGRSEIRLKRPITLEHL